ncbi:MAG: hypothetical protein HYY37_06900 [Candidatus Aenigmarchaeota archaeon]|nr:hypothetical protein [Candidatus Aenigmarchaeota archaeon]
MKGQWFLISAVVASGAFLAISLFFRGYFSASPEKVALADEDYYLWMIKDGMKKTIDISCSQGGLTLTERQNAERNLNEFIQESKNSLAALGYVVEVVLDANLADLCTEKMRNVELILVKSERGEAWEGERPEVEIG